MECSVAGNAERGRESFPVALQGAAALVMGRNSKCRQETVLNRVFQTCPVGPKTNRNYPNADASRQLCSVQPETVPHPISLG